MLINTQFYDLNNTVLFLFFFVFDFIIKIFAFCISKQNSSSYIFRNFCIKQLNINNNNTTKCCC